MNARHVSLLTTLVVALVTLVVGAAYVKFYNERAETYKKHTYVLEHECRSGRQLPQIQYNLMTYDGTSTNCSEALVFTSVPPVLGAVHDMWVASPFFSLMYATDWKIQVSYALFGIVGVVTAIRSYFSHKSQKAVLDTFSSTRDGVRVAKSSIDQRPRLLVKTTSNKTPMQHLAEKLLQNEEELRPPVFTKRDARPSFHCGTAPYVVGTTTPSVSE